VNDSSLFCILLNKTSFIDLNKRSMKILWHAMSSNYQCLIVVCFVCLEFSFLFIAHFSVSLVTRVHNTFSNIYAWLVLSTYVFCPAV